MKYAEIKQLLQAEVPAKYIKTRQQGGATIEYINVTDYKTLLDERAGIWTSDVKDFKEIGGAICVTVEIAIHADDGVYRHTGTGLESLATNSYGDFFSNAFAQGFRRACESHGLSRELWQKDHPVVQAHGRPQQAQAQRAGGGGQGFSTSGGAGGGTLTEKQGKAIWAICKNKGLDENEFIEEMFPGKIKGELTVGEAGDVISALDNF
jgi:hypothetical protein